MHSDIDTPTVDHAVPECVLLTDSRGDIAWASAPSDVLGRQPMDLTTVESLFGPTVPDPPPVGTVPVSQRLTTTTAEGEPRLLDVTAETVPGPDVTTYRCQRVDDEQLGLWTVLSRVTDAVVALTTDWRYSYANDAALALLDTPRAALLGEVIWEVFPALQGTQIQRTFERALATQEPETLEWYWEPADQQLEVRCFPSPTGLSVYFRDITDRLAQETDLRQERDLTEQLLRVSPIGIAVHAPDGRFVRLNERAEEILGVDREELVGEILDEPMWDAYGPDGEAFPDEAFPLNVVLRTGTATFGTEMSLRRADGTRLWLSVSAAPLLDTDGDIERVIVTFEEITERKRYERELTASEQRFRAVFEGTLDALVLTDDEGTYLDVNEAACDLYGLDETALVGRNVADFAPPGYDVAAAWERFIETGTLRGEFPLVRSDGERRVTDFVATSNIAPGLHLSALRDITERKADEERLAAQRDELGRLDEVNELIRRVHRAIVGATDRETIETAVCDVLVTAESYPVAMTTRLTAAEEHQVEYTAGVSKRLRDTLRRDGATCVESALRRTSETNALTVLADLQSDPTYPDPLRRLAADHDLRTIGAIPIEHDGAVYGVLTVGSTHEEAFGRRDGAVFAELGRLLGKAIDAIQTKRLLYANAFLELELSVSSRVEPLAALNDRVGGQWRLEGIVPVEAGRYLLYVDVDGTPVTDIERTVDAVPGIETLRPVEVDSDRLLELRVDHDTPISGLLDAGGWIHDGTIENGIAQFVVDVTLDTDVRTYLDRLEQRGIDAELHARREVERTTPAVWAADGTDLGLTDRQRAVLEAAYLSGYFDWPRRRTTGEELADSLDIATSTLHQHLRVASAKVFAGYFDAGTTGPT
ncbi:PAS domain-containing protein [Haloarcula sp. S1CR25-12]|uniref:PAS domain-containing protein n=1 Tax=Haloarcula saliterrae TaxID=2950534 RepID=A0ABU2FD36_9EURY|nr:PAS domain-containing protein [Haloarcula sp. S1CR25-12]MDS0260122.1 PAS domain-containing protein [Haloarcula sp. S1CR25-12]